jgi:hypothetical protein
MRIYPWSLSLLRETGGVLAFTSSHLLGSVLDELPASLGWTRHRRTFA